jgi:hypothetical protein
MRGPAGVGHHFDELVGTLVIAARHRFPDPIRKVFQGERRNAGVLDPAPHRRTIPRAIACAECAGCVRQRIWKRCNLRLGYPCARCEAVGRRKASLGCKWSLVQIQSPRPFEALGFAGESLGSGGFVLGGTGTAPYGNPTNRRDAVRAPQFRFPSPSRAPREAPHRARGRGPAPSLTSPRRGL